MTNLFFSDLLLLVNSRGDGTAGDSGVHTDMLLSVQSASGNGGGDTDMLHSDGQFLRLSGP